MSDLIRKQYKLQQQIERFERVDRPPFEIGARVYNSANISIANATATLLTYDTERYDTDTIHSTSVNTGRLTCFTAGKYAIFAVVQWAANVTGRRSLQIRINGTTTIVNDSRMAVTDAGAGTVQAVATVYELAVGDYVESIVVQASGGALNVLAVGNVSPEFGMSLMP